MRFNASMATGLVAALLLATAAHAQRNKLEIGSAAPGLDIEEWVKGDQTGIENGKVYIVEFWATWCGPCKVTMPHLTKLQKDYGDKGLTVIGVTNEKVDVVKNWMKSNGDKMGYTVAVDRREATSRAWAQAAGLKGIPAAFIVDKQGRIAFFGNPHPKADGPEMDRILKKVLRGRYDAKLERQAAPALKAARDARRTRGYRMAEMQYKKVIEMNPTVFADVSLELFEMMLVDQKRRAEAYQFAQGTLIANQFAGDGPALRMLAEKIALDPALANEDRDLDTALAAATLALSVEGQTDPEAQSTLALVYFHRGEFDKAVDHQHRAWRLCGPGSKANYRKVLRAYKGAERSAKVGG